MNQPPSEPNLPQQRLNLLDAVAIIAGVIIGAGIFESTPLIAASVASGWELLAVFAIGGFITLVGALCYAELATTYPREGGDYVYLSRAYGRRVGFLFAWCEFWIVRPGNIGLLAYVMARYANEVLPLKQIGVPVGFEFRTYACLAVLVLTAINLLGVQSGKWTQNLLTAVKISGLLAVVIVGLWAGLSGGEAAMAADVTSDTPRETNYQLAMIFVMLTFGGIGEISFVAAEVRQPKRNILRALILGTLTVTLVYLLANAAFLSALGFEGVASAGALATEVVQTTGSRFAAVAISLLIVVSCLGAMNGTIFTGARIYYALGRNHSIYRWLGSWNAGSGPVRALILQAVVAVALICLFGPERQGFENLTTFTAPFFWAFFFLVSVALLVLRSTDGQRERPYRVWLYPFVPGLFVVSTAFMLYSSATYAWSQLPAGAGWLTSARTMWPVVVLVLGLVAMALDRREPQRDSP